ASKNSNFFVRARKYRPENRSLRGVNEDSRTELTPLSRKKCIFRGALKSVRLISTCIVFLALMSGCSSNNPIEVKTDVVTNEFEQFSRYSWYGNSSAEPTDVAKRVGPMVVNIVNEELMMKSYTLVDADSADFYVNYEVTAQDSIDINEMSVYSGLGEGFVWRHGRGVSNEVYVESKEYEVKSFTKGTLIVDVIYAKTDKLVWRGVANKRIEQQLNDVEIKAQLKTAIAKLLKDIPSAQTQ
ncbi:MAG TPA: DUF4136 domain-containing protein, partial [Marinagarivorans sp.]